MSKRPRKPEIANAVRDAMLDAAIRVFAARGYAAATMKEIAADAGYTAPAIYNYFGGKEQLYAALLERTFEEILATFVEPDVLEGSFEERLASLMQRQFELADRRSETFLVLMSLHGSGEPMPAPEAARQAPEGYRRLVAMLTAWFAEACGAGRVGRLAPKDAALLYLAIVQAFHFQWMTERTSEHFADQVDLVLSLFLHGVGGVSAAASRPRAKKRAGKVRGGVVSVSKRRVG